MDTIHTKGDFSQEETEGTEQEINRETRQSRVQSGEWRESQRRKFYRSKQRRQRNKIRVRFSLLAPVLFSCNCGLGKKPHAMSSPGDYSS